MKITAVQKPAGVSFDLISVSGKVLTINGKDYDLDNLESTESVNANRPEALVYTEGMEGGPTKEEVEARNKEIFDYNLLHRFHIDESGTIHGVIYVGKYHNYAWVNNKMKKLFGFDDGIVTLEELTKYLQWHNELQAILDEYTEPLRKKKAAADAVYGDKKTWREAANSMNDVYAEREEKIRALNKRWIDTKGE